MIVPATQRRPSSTSPRSENALEERVIEIQRAVSRGEYAVDTRLLAERLIAAGVLRRAAKA